MSLQHALNSALSVAKDLSTKVVVVGGLAALFWGSKKRTVDVDLQIALSSTDMSNLIGVASRHGLKFKEPIMIGARFISDETEIDFLLATTKLEKEILRTSVSCTILGVNVQCANINELIASKWLAGRSKDIKAINNILLSNSDKVDRDYINSFLPKNKQFYLEPDGSPKQLKKSSLAEIRSLAKRDSSIASRLLQIADLIERELDV